MAGYSRESERQNKHMKSLLSGEKPEKRIFVSVEDEEFKKKLKKEWEEEQELIKEKLDMTKEFRLPWFCPKCKKVMKSHLDDKVWRLYKHCFGCQIQFENKMRINGTWKEYEKKKLLENRLSFIKDMIDSIAEWKKSDAPKFYRQVAADGVTVDEDKWNMDKKYIEKEAKKALIEYKKVKKDIEKELKQYL